MSVLHKMFHLRGVAFYMLVCIIRQLIVGKLAVQDMGREFLCRPAVAVVRQGQQLVETVDL